MITLLSDHYVAQPVTVNDLQIASLAWGFTIGFGFLTTWTAMRQTADMHRRYGYSKLNSPYIWMIWLEILVCLIFSVICWLHLNHIIPPRYLTLPPSISKTQANTRQFCILLRHP
jgi:amino acid transporter